MTENTMQMRVKLDEGAKMPTRAHETDAGLDLYSAEEHARVLPNSWRMVDTGVHVEIPEGYAGLIISKSGMMGMYGITCRGLIDSSYRGSIKAVLFNHSDKEYYVDKWQKVTQLVIVPYLTPELVLVDELEQTERGEAGFGSTGK